MVFSLNCSLARFYRGIIQSSSDLLYPHVYCRPRSSRWLSCTSPRITGSSSISRWRVTRVPISSLVSPPLVSSLCPRCVLVVSSLCPREVFKVPSRVIATSPSFSHCPLFVKSRPVRNSSILTVSSSYHRCIAYWPSPCCQNIFRASSPCCQNNFRTSSLYGHRFITASSRPLNPLSDPCQSYLHAQLKRCQDITSQSLVYHGLLVNASCPRITQPLLRYLFSPPCHQYISNVSPERVGRIPNSLPLCSPAPCQRGYRLASMSPTPR